ncbi:hypothetical protein [Reinekea sp.]|jgi:hypothetical protein|uniref:hypothetical protein n=1 Tax=Reinekea sp. TaxID=1970455 RepID=UPI002A80A4DC|nr:hypothetical protein [Reinekea sp.]
MTLHLRLIQIEMYLPQVTSAESLHKALGALRHAGKNQQNLALTIEPFNTTDRGRFALVVLGTERIRVEQECTLLIDWIEAQIVGQTLATEMNWL